MNRNRKTELTERQARLAQVKAEQKKAERKRTWIIASVAGVLVLGLIGTTIAIVVDQGAKNADLAAQAKEPIRGVKTFTGLSQDHVSTAVDYAQNPPTGGAHSAVGQVCGFYSEPIVDENGVHSLEHGAVWITYDPSLAPGQVDSLRAFAAKDNYVLVSPRDGLASPVVASAWGVQLQLDSAADKRLPLFLAAYVNGPQTPEPGASCSDGVGTPE
ncbi:DUF3105 domain-containing protein [Pengzhenrongella phosphoraccumulans]|uniref:DUF3105 domain-containing protein n=1 Tax=Pengzhenrongella phosphoraccumulans TaxID=3114394 RepID=UPI00388FD107